MLMSSRLESGRNPAGKPDFPARNHYRVDVLKTIFIFALGPPLPRGVPGEGPDCHFPKEIVGVGPIPARIRGFCNLHVGLKQS